MKSGDQIGSWDTRLGDLERDALRLSVTRYPGRIDGTYDNPEAACNVIDDLFDLLDDLAPNGYYFGATDGDGSDFGFWTICEE